MEKKTTLVASVAMGLMVSLAAACGGGGGAQPTTGGAQAGGNASAGQAVFQQNCNSCHPGGNQGTGPAVKGRAADAVTKKVRAGGGGMPAFSASQISDQQLNDLAAYVGTLK